MILIQNGRVKPIAGPDIENGQVLIDDAGKIAAVGPQVQAPEAAQVIDAGPSGKGAGQSNCPDVLFQSCQRNGSLDPT